MCRARQGPRRGGHQRCRPAGGFRGARPPLRQRRNRRRLLHGGGGARGVELRAIARADDHETLTPILTETGRTTRWPGGGATRNKDELAFDLSARNVAALESILAASAAWSVTTSIAPTAGHPDLDADLRRGLRRGDPRARAAIVRGFPVTEHSIDEIERIYWAVLPLRPLVSNNSFGHRMVRVQEEMLPGGVQPARGTKSRAELAMHNDSADVFALLWVHQAARGQEQFTSGPAAHNVILAEPPRTAPDPVPRLPASPPQRATRRPARRDPYDVPIFSNARSVCINFTYSSILPALHELGRELTPEEEEAIDFLRELLVRQQLDVRFEPGEAVYRQQLRACAIRDPTTSTATDPQRAGWCSAPGWRSRSRTAASRRPRVLPHGERRRPSRLRPGTGPRGTHRAATTTPTCPTSSPTCSRPHRPSRRSTETVATAANGSPLRRVDRSGLRRPAGRSPRDIEPFRARLEGDAERTGAEIGRATATSA